MIYDFKVEAESLSALDDTVQLAFTLYGEGIGRNRETTVVAFKDNGEAGITLYVQQVEGSTPLPFPHEASDCARLLRGWLKGAPYGKQPDHDGHNNKGWKIKTPDSWSAILVCHPRWIVYGK